MGIRLDVRTLALSWAMLALGHSNARSRPDPRAPACCCTCWLGLSAMLCALRLLLLLGTRVRAGAAPTYVLCAPRLLLQGPRMLLLRLHRRACAWGMPNCMRERGWEHSTRTRVDPGCVLHHEGPSLVLQGRMVLRHARMHFNQGVLGDLCTDRPLRALLTIGASPHNKDR